MLPNGGPGVGVGDADALGTGFGGSGDGGAVAFAAISDDAINAQTNNGRVSYNCVAMTVNAFANGALRNAER
jgi:hypothetical protein